MAIPLSLQFPIFSSPKSTQLIPSYLSVQNKPKKPCLGRFRSITKIRSRKRDQFIINAVQDNTNNNDPETSTTQQEEPSSERMNTEVSKGKDELSEIGAEIKKAMKERGEKKEADVWSGVAEEIKEIEWPAFNKVLATTGVVLGVIAGSSVVLLTVNAVLAELSDRVFAGRGVQDFFG